MAKIITVEGHNGTDEAERAEALEKLNDLPTIVLTRLADCTQSPKAVNYFKNSLLYQTLKTFLK